LTDEVESDHERKLNDEEHTHEESNVLNNLPNYENQRCDPVEQFQEVQRFGHYKDAV
jgi:hypothetical protein